MRDGECVAMVWFFVRSYQMGHQRREILELMDWATLPEVRGLGLGIRLLRTKMDQPEPILNVGGSADTHKYLPQLGWKPLGSVPQFLLPLQASPGLLYLKERANLNLTFLSPALDAIYRYTAGIWFKPAAGLVDPEIRVEQVSAPGDELLHLYAEEKGDRTTPLPHVQNLRWLMKAPAAMGRYSLLYFRTGIKLRGWSLSRVCATRLGKVGQIIDFYAPPSEESILPTVVGGTVRALAAHAPGSICVGATLPSYQAAFRRNHFIHRSNWPIFYWSPDATGPTEPIVLSNQTSDLSLLPYPIE